MCPILDRRSYAGHTSDTEASLTAKLATSMPSVTCPGLTSLQVSPSQVGKASEREETRVWKELCDDVAKATKAKGKTFSSGRLSAAVDFQQR